MQKMLDRYTVNIVMVLLSIGCVFMAWNVALLSWSFINLPPQGDAYVFFIVARGLLNGLRLYWDVFEVKPPLALWLMALSLQMKNMNLYIYVQIALLTSLAPILSLVVYRNTKNILATAFTFLFGITLAYEIMNKTAAYLPEGFGAPITVYALLIFIYGKYPPFRLLVSGILVGVSTMIKEPFAASFILAALIFCKSYKDLQRLFAVLCIGGITSIFILFATNSLGGYFQLYLPEMLTGRSVGGVHYPDFNLGVYYFVSSSLWLRTLNAFKLFIMLATPVHSLFFSAFVFVCVGIFAPLKTQFSKRSIGFSFSCIMTILFAGHVFYSWVGLMNALHWATKSIHVNELGYLRPILLPLVPIVMGSLQLLAVLLLPLVCVCVYFFAKRISAYWPGWNTTLFIIFTLVMLFCSAALVAFGGDYIGQYFGFIVAPLVALVSFVVTEGSNRKYTTLLGVLSLLLLMNAFVPGKVERDLRPYMTWSEVQPEIERANALDTLLDACDTERFFAVRSIQLFGPFMQHSPYQAFWGQQRAFGAVWPDIQNQKPHSYFRQKLFQDLSDAKIVVASSVDDPTIEQISPTPQIIAPKLIDNETTHSRIPTDILPVLTKEFSINAPACAAGLVPIDGLKIFFRKE